ncbi:hypothetical protein [Streptomyces sp. 8N616]|uniref:hypothetical protein n=1 Tax=Streptomyces sp. 8N616 TaxID=3457414 RepID=UPI003FCFC8F2
MSIGGHDYDEREHMGTGSAPRGRQTRTRLPDGEAYGDGRRARGAARPSKSMITVVGVVVLLIAAIAFANRDNSGDGDASGAGSSSEGSEAQPTAPTGKRPVSGSDAGIASGFPRTEQGAQSAAANYAVALGGDGMFQAETRRQIVDTVYAPDVAAARQDDLDRVYSDREFLAGIGLKPDGTAPKGLTFVSRTNPIGTKLQKLEGNTATVAVWFSTLFGLAGEGSKNPVAESWYTNTFQLRWAGGAWKVTDFEQKNGPTPVGRDQTASSAEDMADAVQGFGGFTYAR